MNLVDTIGMGILIPELLLLGVLLAGCGLVALDAVTELHKGTK